MIADFARCKAVGSDFGRRPSYLTVTYGYQLARLICYDPTTEPHRSFAYYRCQCALSYGYLICRRRIVDPIGPAQHCFTIYYLSFVDIGKP